METRLRDETRAQARDQAWPAAAAVLLVVVAGVWGRQLDPHTLQLDAPPLVGVWDLRLSLKVLLPVVVGVGAWQAAPALQQLPWKRLLGASWLLAIAWSVSLALTDGVNGLRGPLLSRDEYLHDVHKSYPGGFLPTFTQHIVDGDRWTTHVGGHPPGLLLLLKGLDRVGLSGPWPLVILFVGAGTSAVVAVLLTVRTVVDEQTARACAPFLALAPAAIWVAVSADALFLGVTAWGVALLALKRPVAGGLVLGASLFLTYGALPLGLLALAVTRRWKSLIPAAAGVLAVVLGFALAGFWWLDGLQTTYTRVHAGAGGYRPFTYFVVANVAALAVAVGPATAVGLRRLSRRDPLWWLVGAALVGLLVADLSGTARGEVERIWLPYTPWLLVATARLRDPRPWLAAQLAIGLVVQLVLRSKW
jgi:hypothetical protein